MFMIVISKRDILYMRSTCPRYYLVLPIWLMLAHTYAISLVLYVRAKGQSFWISNLRHPRGHTCSINHLFIFIYIYICVCIHFDFSQVPACQRCCRGLRTTRSAVTAVAAIILWWQKSVECFVTETICNNIRLR